jgi:hypothetical protein
MIVQTFDCGWGPDWPAKQFEIGITNPLLRRFCTDASRTVIINSTWYSQEFHQQVMTQLRTMQFDRIVLVAMLDPAIPKLGWYAEFECEVVTVGYYAGPGAVDYWALLTAEHNQDQPSMDPARIDTAYMCLNRKPHWHRRRLYNELLLSGLLDLGMVSMGNQRILPVDREHDDLAPEPTRELYGIPNDIVSLGHPDNWARSFLNIVTETAWNINQTGFVSEKIYKPVVGCRPFLVFDPDGATRWLTDRGFEPYTQDFQDISTLDLANPDNMVMFLQTLCVQPQSYWQSKFLALQDKIMYNKTQFDCYVKQQKLIIEKGI